MNYLKKISFIALLCLLLAGTGLSAQQKAEHKKTGRKFNIENLKKEQADFLNKELNLTQEEYNKFIPLVNEYMDKKFAISRVIHKMAKQLKQNPSTKDQDYKSLNDAIINSKIEEAQLQKEYYEKYKNVLSARKIHKYFASEMKFMRIMVEKHIKNRNK